MARRAISLGPKPSLLGLFVSLREQKLFSPKIRTFGLVCSVSPLVSPQPLFTLPFDSLSLCLLFFFLPSSLSFFLSFAFFLSFVCFYEA